MLLYSNCCISLVENSSHYIEKSVKQHPQSRPTHITYSISFLTAWVIKSSNYTIYLFSVTCYYLAQCRTHFGVLLRWLRSLPPVYPSVSSPLVSVHSQFHPSNLARHGPFSLSPGVSICVPSHPSPSPSSVISFPLCSSCLPSDVVALTLEEFSSHRSQRPIKM